MAPATNWFETEPAMITPIRAALYQRVSTGRQADNDLELIAPVRPARHEQVNKILCRCAPRPRSWMRVRRSRKAAVERRWRRAYIESKTHTKKRAGAWAIDIVRISQEAPSGRFTRRPLNLNSHNHNQRGRRPRFSLAVQTAGLAAFKRMNAAVIPLYEMTQTSAR